MAAAAARDEDAVRARSAVYEEVVVGRVGIEARAATEQPAAGHLRYAAAQEVDGHIGELRRHGAVEVGVDLRADPLLGDLEVALPQQREAVPAALVGIEGEHGERAVREALRGVDLDEDHLLVREADVGREGGDEPAEPYARRDDRRVEHAAARLRLDPHAVGRLVDRGHRGVMRQPNA